MRAAILPLKYLLAVAVVLLVFMPVASAAEDIDRWANIESWEGSFSVSYRHGSYTNYRYRGTINLDEKRIYKRKRQTEWKAVRWKGELKSSGNYHMEMNYPELEARVLVQASGPVSDEANLKIDKRKGTYSLHIGFNVQATQRTWYKGSSVGTEKKSIAITSPLLAQPLAEGGLVLKGSSSFAGDVLPAVVEMAGASGSLKAPIWVVSWQLWPKGSNPEPTLEYEEAGKDWLPEDDNTVKAVLKWDKNSVPSEVRFTLYDISEEPGIYLNSRDKNTDLDLEFDEKNKSLKFKIIKSAKTFVATKKELPTNEESIILHAKDFGAYGKLKAEINIAGSWFVATAKPFELSYLPVPYDKNDNYIADKWEKDVGVYSGGYGPEWDDDPYPSGQKTMGDGFTLYEEYRGFREREHVFRKGDNEQVKDDHVRMDPMYKDIFIYDPDGLFLTWYKPFNPADLNWHLVDQSMMKDKGKLHLDPDKRWVNFNTSKKHFNRKQYALYIRDDGYYKGPDDRAKDSAGEARKFDGAPKTNRALHFPLKSTYKVSIYTDTLIRVVTQVYKEKGLERYTNRVIGGMLGGTVIHELGHAIGMVHHNDLESGWFTGKGARSGVLSCVIRYESKEEFLHPERNNFLRTSYCKEKHNCYSQINIKGN